MSAKHSALSSSSVFVCAILDAKFGRFTNYNKYSLTECLGLFRTVEPGWELRDKAGNQTGF